eukprot:TRINITY_DN7710_c0_g1_i1.p1 TRINITY_DN7710_c0_g1~~TRINITY_DN7710_c0_g1_i1.p1  ORF type:complete len:121 (-),score=29.40 TRINITY_DN7710_c0_g1_i1:232-594(-)
MIATAPTFVVFAPALCARSSRTTASTVVNASQHSKIQHKATIPKNLNAAIVSSPFIVGALPALAIVDERMNGDGVGFAFGFNEPVLFWTVFGVFSLIWGAYFVAQRDMGGDEDEDAGLSL